MVDYSESIEVYNIKVGTYSKQKDYMETYMTRGQGYSSTFVQAAIAVKPLDRLKSNYILSLHETRGPKSIETVQVT